MLNKMLKVHLGLLPFLVFLVRAMDLQLSPSSARPCSNNTLTFTCFVDDTAQSVLFHKGNASTRAQCVVDLSRACSPTFPAGFSCGCVEDDGKLKTIQFKIEDISFASNGTWLSAIPVRGASDIVSNNVSIIVDDREAVVPPAIALLATLGVVILIIIVVVILVLVKVEATAVKIAVVAVGLVILLAFELAVGIYNLNDHLDCTRDTPDLYGGSVACLVIGALVGVGSVIALIVVEKS